MKRPAAGARRMGCRLIPLALVAATLTAPAVQQAQAQSPAPSTAHSSITQLVVEAVNEFAVSPDIHIPDPPGTKFTHYHIKHHGVYRSYGTTRAADFESDALPYPGYHHGKKYHYGTAHLRTFHDLKGYNNRNMVTYAAFKNSRHGAFLYVKTSLRDGCKDAAGGGSIIERSKVYKFDHPEAGKWYYAPNPPFNAYDHKHKCHSESVRFTIGNYDNRTFTTFVVNSVVAYRGESGKYHFEPASHISGKHGYDASTQRHMYYYSKDQSVNGGEPITI